MHPRFYYMKLLCFIIESKQKRVVVNDVHESMNGVHESKNHCQPSNRLQKNLVSKSRLLVDFLKFNSKTYIFLVSKPYTGMKKEKGSNHHVKSRY